MFYDFNENLIVHKLPERATIMATIDHVDSVVNTHDWRGNVRGMAEDIEQQAAGVRPRKQHYNRVLCVKIN